MGHEPLSLNIFFHHQVPVFFPKDKRIVCYASEGETMLNPPPYPHSENLTGISKSHQSLHFNLKNIPSDPGYPICKFSTYIAIDL